MSTHPVGAGPSAPGPGKRRPAHRDGVGASRVRLPAGAWSTVLDALEARFPDVGRDAWHARMARGRVTGADGNALAPDARFRGGCVLHYFREVADEPAIPFEETVLYADAHLLVVDKPHFLPVMPAGRYVRETLLARLVRRTGNAALVPLHRLDRLTAGLVLFSADPSSRDRYHALFRDHAVSKTYEALAPALPELGFPLVRRSRLVRGQPFQRMCEVEGEANSETRVEVMADHGRCWRYRLQPSTGRKHQLRVHMAALGAPILNDTLYPLASAVPGADAPPLQLLARTLAFNDPVSGQARCFESMRSLYASPDD